MRGFFVYLCIKTITMFERYQHLERFGTTETQGIEFGTCYVFPKLDGTNASVWFEGGQIKAGSRNRELSLEKDNAGFYEWAINNQNLKNFFDKYPELRLYGEWLVPHSLKTYRDDAWRRFYVFDVMNGEEYLPYEKYNLLLAHFEIDYIPAFYIAKNASYDQFAKAMQANTFMIKDGEGVGEGIVIKNYDYVNKYGRNTWAKIVTSEFKEKHIKEMGAMPIKGEKMIEEEIVDKYVTIALCEKELAKLEQEGFTSKMIPRLLNTIFYNLVKEECWNFVKEHKNPNINFKTLQHFCVLKVKKSLPKLF